MQVIGDFNNVSEQLVPRILAPGEMVKYQYLKGTPNDDENPTSRQARPIFYKQVDVLRLQDRIYDPYKKQYVRIGVPIMPTKDDPGRCKRFEYFAADCDGQIVITGGNADQQEMFEFFELTNRNLSNPNRDKTADAWLKRIDDVQEAKEENKRNAKLKTAIVFADGMSDIQRRELAAAMGWDERADGDILVQQIDHWVMSDPSSFLKFVADEKGLKERGIIKAALTREIINFDTTANRIVWADSKTAIAALERSDKKDHVEQFYDWIMTNKNGQNILKSLTTKLNQSIKDSMKDKESEA